MLSGLDYDPQRMSAAIYDAIQHNSADALIVSIPDYEVLKAPIMAARDKGIPVIAVYSGLQAAKDLGILAVMSDEVWDRYLLINNTMGIMRAVNEMSSHFDTRV